MWVHFKKVDFVRCVEPNNPGTALLEAVFLFVAFDLCVSCVEPSWRGNFIFPKGTWILEFGPSDWSAYNLCWPLGVYNGGELALHLVKGAWVENWRYTVVSSLWSTLSNRDIFDCTIYKKLYYLLHWLFIYVLYMFVYGFNLHWQFIYMKHLFMKFL